MKRMTSCSYGRRDNGHKNRPYCIVRASPGSWAGGAFAPNYTNFLSCALLTVDTITFSNHNLTAAKFRSNFYE
jgi:hypothetical protein